MLGGAADAIRGPVRLRLNNPGRLLRHAQRHLGNAVIRVDHLPRARTVLACETAWRFWDERRASSSACDPEKPSAFVN